MDLNKQEYLENDFDEITGENKGVLVEVLEIKNKSSQSGTPGFILKFGAIDGELSGRIIRKHYYITPKTELFIRILAIACNLFEERFDDKGVLRKFVNEGFVPSDCVGCKLKIDTYIENYNGENRTKVRNETRIEKDDF